MKSKLTVCKVCGAEISKDATSCPKCGAQNPIVKKAGKTAGIIILVAIVLIIIVAATSGADEPTKLGEITGDGTGQQEAESTFTVGDVVELKDIVVKFLSVKETDGSEYNSPTDGNVFLLCEFEIVNNSKKEVAVSSLLSFNAYCDDYSCSLSLSALLEKGDKNQLDGTIAAGKKMTGVIGYEVPADWKNFEVRFTPDFWSGKEIVFVAENK